MSPADPIKWAICPSLRRTTAGKIGLLLNIGRGAKIIYGWLDLDVFPVRRKPSTSMRSREERRPLESLYCEIVK